MKLSRNVSLLIQITFFGVCLVFPGLRTWAQSGVVRPRTTTGELSSPLQPKPVVSSTAGQSTLIGRVIYQDNEQPLKGARVTIFTAAEVERPLVAFANNNGEFQVSKLGAGKYYVTVAGPGIATASGIGMRLPLPMSAIPRPGDFEEIIPRHDAAFTADGSSPVTLEVRIKRGGSISGKVFKADGSPAENVVVNLVSRESSMRGPITSQFTGLTAKNGEFRIDFVPAAEYLVTAAVDDARGNLDIRARMRGEGRVVTYHPATINANDATRVRVVPGQETRSVNITLVPRNAYTVSGTVLRQLDGSPIVGATVLLRNKNSEMSSPLMPGLAQRTTHTDAQGNWSFLTVTEGDYVITALAPLIRPRPAPGELDRERAFRESRQRFLVKQQDIMVSGADLKGVSLAISGPGSIRGTVEMDDGAALPRDLVIFLELVTENNRPSPPLPVKVGADGSFRFSDIQAGDVFISAAFQSDSNYVVESVMAGANNLRQTPLTVIEGADSEPIRIKISSGVATVAGRVLSKSGDGLGDWVVLAVPAHPSERRFRTSLLSVRTAADGSFRLSGVPGEYVVFTLKREDMPGILTPEFFQKDIPGAKRVTLKRGEQTVDLEVKTP